jgi:hypothetical protein
MNLDDFFLFDESNETKTHKVGLNILEDLFPDCGYGFFISFNNTRQSYSLKTGE